MMFELIYNNLRTALQTQKVHGTCVGYESTN